MRFTAGLLIGLVCALGAALGYERWQLAQAPCRSSCGKGTHCVEGTCEVAPAEATTRKRRHRPRRRGRRRRTSAAAADTPALKTPGPTDRAPLAQGSRLGGADRIDMTSDSAAPELDEAEVEQRFRRLDGRIIDCIDRAREGWDVSGKVVVGFRLERSGRVQKVRVTAPALMQRAGIYACIAPLVKGLHYPASGRSLIMSYPYRLD